MMLRHPMRCDALLTGYQLDIVPAVLIHKTTKRQHEEQSFPSSVTL